jgi:hypothetical protein
MELITKSGDTVIGVQQTLESLLVLSEQSRKRVLLPLLYKLPSLRLNVAYFLQSLVIHEQLYFTSSQANFETLLTQAGLEVLSDFVRPLSPDILVEKVENTPHSPEVANIKLAYERLVSCPATAVSNDVLELFNSVFPNFAVKKGDNEWASIYHNAGSRHLAYYDRLASIAAGLAYSSLGGDTPSKDGYQLYSEQVLDKTKSAAEQKVQQANEWLKQSRFSIDAPLVFGHIVERARHKRDIVSAAMEVRNSREATAFRRQCSLFDHALKTGDDKALIEMANEIDDKIKQLTERVGGAKINIDISFPLSITISPSELWEYIRAQRKRHLIFVGQLYDSAITSRNTFERFSQML